MAFHTIYRSAPGENLKGRPPFYSKDVALRSFLDALGTAPSGDRVFVNDGVLPEERTALMAQSGEVVRLPAIGNSRSFRACLGIAESRGWDDDDFVYFCEDDYLHLPQAFSTLATAIGEIRGADYFTLYDHPDYYRMIRHRAFAVANRRRTSSGGSTWHPVRSTCLTFGGRVGALRCDAWVFHLCSRYDPPADYAIWTILCGAGISFLVPRALKPPGRPRSRTLVHGWLAKGRRPVRRVLLGAVPALATHAQTHMLSPGVDWNWVAAQAASGAR